MTTAIIEQEHKAGRWAVQVWTEAGSYVGVTVMHGVSRNIGPVLEIIAARMKPGVNYTRTIAEDMKAQARAKGYKAVIWTSPRPWHRLISEARLVETTYMVEV